MSKSRQVLLMDTTLRDGEQTQGVSFSPEEKVSIARGLLQSLKVDRIEVASAGVSHGEKQAVTQIHEWAAENDCLERVEVLGFTDHRRSVDWLAAASSTCLPREAKNTAGSSSGSLLTNTSPILSGQSTMPRRSNFWSMSIWKIGRTVIGTAVIMSTESPKHLQTPTWCT